MRWEEEGEEEREREKKSENKCRNKRRSRRGSGREKTCSGRGCTCITDLSMGIGCA